MRICIDMVHISYVNFRFQILRVLSKLNLFCNLKFMKVINNVNYARLAKHDSINNPYLYSN